MISPKPSVKFKKKVTIKNKAITSTYSDEIKNIKYLLNNLITKPKLCSCKPKTTPQSELVRKTNKNLIMSNINKQNPEFAPNNTIFKLIILILYILITICSLVEVLLKKPFIIEVYSLKFNNHMFKFEDFKNSTISLNHHIEYYAYNSTNTLHGYNGFKLDNCCSFSLTGNIKNLRDVIKLTEPVVINGLKSSVSATHCGTLPWLPKEISKCYFIPGINNNLISLGYIVKQGGAYYAYGSKLTVHFKDLSLSSPLDPVSLVHNVILYYDQAFTKNKFEEFSVNSLISTHLKNATLSSNGTPENSYKSTNSNETLNIYKSDEKSENTPILANSGEVSNINKTSSIHPTIPIEVIPPDTDNTNNIKANSNKIFSKAHLERAQAIRTFHINNGHPSVGVMTKAASLGFLGPTGAEDVKLYSQIYDCGACLTGKFRNLPRKEIHSVTATNPGQILTIDLRLLKGNSDTQELFIVDKFSGSFHVIPLSSKSAENIFEGLMLFINLTFKAFQWSTSKIYCDAEPVFEEVRCKLASVGIDLVSMCPEDHASMVERYTQELDKRVTSILNGLPYLLPTKYLINLHQHVAYQMNLLPNTRTFKLSTMSTPFLLRTRGQNPVSPCMQLAFGDLCLIKLGDGQRDNIRKSDNLQKQSVSRAGYGVFLGRVPNNSTTLYFLQSNGIIVIRRDFKVIKGYIPFGWEEKEIILTDMKTKNSLYNDITKNSLYNNVKHYKVTPNLSSNEPNNSSDLNNNKNTPNSSLNESINSSNLNLNNFNPSPVFNDTNSDYNEPTSDITLGFRKSKQVSINLNNNIEYNHGPHPSSIPIPQYEPSPENNIDNTVIEEPTPISLDTTDLLESVDNLQRRSIRISNRAPVNYANSSIVKSSIKKKPPQQRKISDGVVQLNVINNKPRI